jgi:type IV secretion system protein VirB5
MKKLNLNHTKITFSAIVLMLGFVGTASAGMPVFDASNFAQAIQQVTTAAQQLEQLRQQYATLQQEYQSISGIRSMGDLVNNSALRKYLPDDYQQILQGGYSAAQSIRDSSRVSGFSNTNPETATSKAFEKSGMQASINEAVAEDGYKQASRRFDDIQTLLDKINTAPDQKSILDLQARIQVEQVMQQNEATKLAMLGQLASAQKDLAQQAQIERRIKNRHETPQMPTNW